MSGLITPVVFLMVSGWTLGVADSVSALVRIARDVQSERLEALLREMLTGEFHHGSGDSPLALSSEGTQDPEGSAAAIGSGKKVGDIDRNSTGEHHLNSHGHDSGDHQLSGHGHEHTPGEHHLNGNGHLTGGDHLSGHGHQDDEHHLSGHGQDHTPGEHHLNGNGHLTGDGHLSGHGHHDDEHHLSAHTGNGTNGGGTGRVHGNAQGPQGDPPSGGHGTSSSHSSATGGSAAGMEHQSAGQVHHKPTVSGDHDERPEGVATGGSGASSRGEQEIMGELLEMWAKIGPELDKIAAMGGNMSGAGASTPHPPPPREVSVGGAGSMGGNHHGGIPHGGTGRTGTGSNGSSLASEVVYLMLVPGYGGRGGYTIYNTAGTYKLAQGAATAGSVTYTAIPVGSVTTRGYSMQARPMSYGGTGGRGGITYKAWPVKYGAGASVPYTVVAYNAVPVGQVVSTRAQQGGVRPAATAQAAYYVVQSGRTAATTKQRPSGGVTYEVVPAVVMPAQTYRVASG